MSAACMPVCFCCRRPDVTASIRKPTYYLYQMDAMWLQKMPHLLKSLATFIPFFFLVPPNNGTAFKNLVTFGDSYTDTSEPGDNTTAWPIYATGYSHTTLFPFAKSGATCSNNITPRPFPSLMESQVPTYLDEFGNSTAKLQAEDTLYSLWIGTNDLGRNSLLTSNEASLVEVTQCAVNWVTVMYNEAGARNFLFQNMIPLQETVLYSAKSYPNVYWMFERNSTEWNLFMTELVLAGNKLTQLLLQMVAPTFPDAHIALFDSHSLFQDMIDNPAAYLNGTAPFNVTWPINSCVYQIDGPIESCTVVPEGPDRDSYLWYDELHPSEQADRMLAKEIAEVLEGKFNKWTTWIS